MIEYTRGNILESGARYIVIPVNCVGALGRGLALDWSYNAPDECLRYYVKKCAAGDIEPGKIMTFEDSCYILATTKDHWIRRSQYEWIDSICEDLTYFAIQRKLWKNDEAIAVPKLGCGLGKLKWAQVSESMRYHFTQSPARFLIYY